MNQHQNPVKAIREFCLGCCGDSPLAVRECAAPDCALYAFRMGSNPYRKKRELTEEQRAVMGERLNRNRRKEEENA